MNTSENRMEHNCEVIQGYPLQVAPLSEEDGGGFQALFPPLVRSVVGYGATQQEAVADLQKAVPLFLQVMKKTGQTLPLMRTQK